LSIWTVCKTVSPKEVDLKPKEPKFSWFTVPTVVNSLLRMMRQQCSGLIEMTAYKSLHSDTRQPCSVLGHWTGNLSSIWQKKKAETTSSTFISKLKKKKKGSEEDEFHYVFFCFVFKQNYRFFFLTLVRMPNCST